MVCACGCACGSWPWDATLTFLVTGSFRKLPSQMVPQELSLFMSPALSVISIIFPTGKRGGPFSIDQIQPIEQSRGLDCIYKMLFFHLVSLIRPLLWDLKHWIKIGAPQSPTSVGSVWNKGKWIQLDDFRQWFECRMSLLIQWLRVPLSKQGTRVQSLVREDPTCHGGS